MADISKLDTAKLIPYSAFIVNRYLQHMSAKYAVRAKQKYRVYQFSDGTTLRDSMIFSFSWSTIIAAPQKENGADGGDGEKRDDEVAVSFKILETWSYLTALFYSIRIKPVSEFLLLAINIYNSSFRGYKK